VQLEDENSTERLMTYLNEVPTAVDDREVVAAAKLIHWTMNRAEARELQVTHAIAVARRLVKRADHRLGLDGRTAAICCIIFDVLHQGRGTFPRIEQALRSNAPQDALLHIGANEFPDRIKGLRDGIGADARFLNLHWSTNEGKFV
jgi:hypothetical protein